jgi:hypothetical protein
MRTFVESLSYVDSLVTAEIIIDNKGDRYINISKEHIEFDPRIEKGYGLNYSQIVFKSLFKAFNYDRNKTLSSNEIVNLLENISLQGMKFNTKSGNYLYYWEEIIQPK